MKLWTSYEIKASSVWKEWYEIHQPLTHVAANPDGGYEAVADGSSRFVSGHSSEDEHRQDGDDDEQANHQPAQWREFSGEVAASLYAFWSSDHQYLP